MMMTLLLLLVSSAAVCCATDPDPSWTRAEKLVGQMTLACALPPASHFLRRPEQRAICPASAPLIPAGSTGTRSEKVQLLQGTAKAAGPDPEVPRPYVGRVPGIERLKIPDLNMNDGPYARHTFLLCPLSSVDLSAALAACLPRRWPARTDLLWLRREGFRCSGQVCPPGSTTQFPSGLTVAHSWDPALFGEWGTAMGAE
jgi:hypothetical protein